ncbi:MAG: hypothetical protein KGR98_05370 [Verrucomicrobia bacterium]|nr:hypothetical protein [Verrucomicrobiota bacterium]MDE3098869.1 hypothetical protein [Verrucomicrobiota bacterium]
MGKIIPFPGNRRQPLKPPAHRPKRFLTEEFHRGRREDHTQEQFVSRAMNQRLAAASRWKPPVPPSHSQPGRLPHRSPSTLRWNIGNVKRKPAARGRAS